MSLRSSISVDDGMSVFPMNQDHEIDFSDSIASLKIASCSGGMKLADGASHFIIAFGAALEVNTGEEREHLRPECFGVFSGPAVLEGDGRALVVSMDNYACPRLKGGPVEQEGRLRYVDGCSATILLSPPVKGEPCFNFMHLPARSPRPCTRTKVCGSVSYFLEKASAKRLPRRSISPLARSSSSLLTRNIVSRARTEPYGSLSFIRTPIPVRPMTITPC